MIHGGHDRNGVNAVEAMLVRRVALYEERYAESGDARWIFAQTRAEHLLSRLRARLVEN